MTAALANHLANLRDVRRVNLASQARSGVLRHLDQALRCLTAVCRIGGHRLRGNRDLSIGCNGGLGKVYTLTLVAAGRITGARMTLHHHSYDYLLAQSRLMAAVCAVGGRRLTHVFLAPSMQATFFARYPQRGPAAVVANAMFVPERRLRQGVPGRLTVGLISNLAPEKGLTDFIATARLARAEGLPVEMVLAGPAPDPADRAAIDAAVADGVLRAVGPLYGPQKDAFFESLDLFLFPTRYRHEAQPTVIYEAFAAGVPVIAFDRGAIVDQVGDCLLTVPREADFAAAAVAEMRRLLTLDAEGRAALHARAQARHRDATEDGIRTIRALFQETAP